MKRAGWLMLGLLPAVVSADLTAARNMMTVAMSDLGNMSQMGFSLTGTETRDYQVVQLQTEVAVYRTMELDNQLRTYFELRSFRDGVLSRRLVGDGLRLWIYRPYDNTYSSITYDLKNGKQRDGDGSAIKLFQSARRYVSGLDSALVQMLIESHQARNIYTNPLINTWYPIMPNSTIELMPVGFKAWTTVPRETYVEYEISNPAVGDYRLLNLNYGLEQRVDGRKLITTQYNVNVLRNTIPATAGFQFNPGNARPVAVGLPQGGG